MSIRRSNRGKWGSSEDITEINRQFEFVASTTKELLSYEPKEVANKGARPKSQVLTKPNVIDGGERTLVDSINRLSQITEDLSSKVDSLGSQLQATSEALAIAMSRVQCLEDVNDRLRNNMNILRNENNSLSDRIDALEQRQREKFIIINGTKAMEGLPVGRELNANHSRNDSSANDPSYSKIDPALFEGKLKETLNMDIPNGSIARVNYLGKDKRRVLCELRDIDLKGKILSKTAKDRPRDFYVNEFLTRRRSTLFYKLRQMQRGSPKKFHSAFTFKGDIYYKLLENSTKTRIDSEIDLIDLGKLLNVDVPAN